MIGPRSFLEYAHYRYLKAAVALMLASIAVYLVEDPPGGRSGSSWTGYGLGTLAAGLIVWLMWLGLRKRSYRDVGPPLQGWTSAHVYLGTSLLLLVPLHCAFEFGANVHTLAYALMCGVIATGIVGVGLYALVPTSITRNRNNITLDAMLERIAEIDADCRVAAENLPDHYAKAVITSIEETRLGGGLLAQLAGRDPDCGTARALASLRSSEIDLQGDARLQELKLIELVARKELLVNQIRRDVRMKGLLDLWLVLHVPLAFATVAAVLVHVFVVFWYH